MRVLVTGHEGYLGTVLVPVLRDAGHEVVGLDIGMYAECVLGPEPAPVPTIRVDIRDVLPEHCAGFDAVLHLAALCNDPIGNMDADLTYDINHRASVRLARAAKAAGVGRFLFSSSCSLYGAGADDTPLTESAGFAPVTPYGDSKIRSEQDIIGLADDDFSPVFLRNATAYGFSPRLRGDLVVNDLVAHALFTGEVRLLSDGTAWRPLVHAADIAAAFGALLVAPREVVHGKAYNIGSSSRELPDPRRGGAGGGGGTGQPGGVRRRGEPGRPQLPGLLRPGGGEVPAFRPQWTVATGIAQLLENYQRYGLTLDAFTGDKFQRLRQIRALQGAGRLDAKLRMEPQPVGS